MAFDGKEGKAIPLDTASKWTKNYQSNNPKEVKASFYGKEKLQELLDEPESMGIRIYYGIDDNGAKKLVLVAARADQTNILPTDTLRSSEPIILNDGAECPPYCSPDSNDPL